MGRETACRGVVRGQRRRPLLGKGRRQVFLTSTAGVGLQGDFSESQLVRSSRRLQVAARCQGESRFWQFVFRARGSRVSWAL